MTDTGLVIVSGMWVWVTWYAIVGLERFANAWLDSKDTTTTATAPVEIPPDLTALALGESEKWAQDATLQTIRERYEKYHDWNQVRRAVGIGEVDA